MYFISPPSPNIFLMNGIYDHQLLGYGEKDGKLCPPVSSNLLINNEGEVLSVIKKANLFSFENRIKLVSLQSSDFHRNFSIVDNDSGFDWLWHELAFSSITGYCLSRRKKGDKILLQLFYVEFSAANNKLMFSLFDYYTVDTNLPSFESINFFVCTRIVDKEYIPKRSTKMYFKKQQLYIVPFFIYFQTPNGSTVTIPLEVLSLSQLAYLSLARFSQSSQAHHSLQVAVISCMYYYFQRILNFCGPSKENVSKKENKEDYVWMSQDFIKKKIGWPRILPLIKVPNLPTKSE